MLVCSKLVTLSLRYKSTNISLISRTISKHLSLLKLEKTGKGMIFFPPIDEFIVVN